MYSVTREFKEQTGAAEAVVSAYASAVALTSSLNMGEFSVLNVEKHSEMTEFQLLRCSTLSSGSPVLCNTLEMSILCLDSVISRTKYRILT